MKIYSSKIIYLCTGVIFTLFNVDCFPNHLVGEENPLCLSEGLPEKSIKLSGKLVRRLFPGPPEYSSIESGDRADHCWMLQIDKTSLEIAVTTPVPEPANDLKHILKQPNHGEIHLSLDENLSGFCLDHIGKEVVVEGYLFHAHTVHHYTPILMSVIKFH